MVYTAMRLTFREFHAVHTAQTEVYAQINPTSQDTASGDSQIARPAADALFTA